MSSSASRQSDLSPALRASRLILPALLLAGHCFFKQLEQSCTSMSTCRSCRTDLPNATELVTNSDEQAMTVLPTWACLGDSTVPTALNPTGSTCSPSDAPMEFKPGSQEGPVAAGLLGSTNPSLKSKISAAPAPPSNKQGPSRALPLSYRKAALDAPLPTALQCNAVRGLLQPGKARAG